MMPLPPFSSVRHSLSVSGHLPASSSDHPLATALARELADRWRRGEQPRAEEFFGRHPELVTDAEAALQLIYEEFCQRQEHGEEPPADELFSRFPQWRPQLEVLLDCHRLLGPELSPPVMPNVGEVFGDFLLQRELGRGAVGCVYLATQPELGDRPMVLKVTPSDGHEHLALARLQHTGIVPLYWTYDEPNRRLRVLCMPYFGGAPLSAVVARLQAIPPARRSGKDLVDALDAAQRDLPMLTPGGPTRAALTRLSYAQAICFIGIRLADALQYAHERQLVHLDLKPSNVLLASDAEPMLLDFHLARAPLRAGDPPPESLGGTPDFMSPEQVVAVGAVGDGFPIPAAVDGRSDIYSLGLVLYEALTDRLPEKGKSPRHFNPEVSAGLSAIIERCLKFEAAERYPGAAALARDLRRELTDLPLLGVAERGTERLRKWRRRKPAALALIGLKLLVAALLVLLLAGGGFFLLQRRWDAEAALAQSGDMLHRGDRAGALASVNRGRELLPWILWGNDVSEALEQQAERIREAERAHHLHTLAEQLRFLVDSDSLSPEQRKSLEVDCRALWDARGQLLADADAQVRDDLLDVALLGADLRVRLAAPAELSAARKQALATLDEAVTSLGTSPALERERQSLAAAMGKATDPSTAPPPRTAWEHYTVGRSLLRAGRLEEAAAALDKSIALQPKSFWPHFYRGTCAYRLDQPRDAVEAFHVSIALAPDKAECYCNRGLAYAALQEFDRAAEDYRRALELQPTLTAAALNRGVLRLRQKEYDGALADFRVALENGAEPGLVHLNMAKVHLGRNDRAAARASLQQALQHRPELAEAKRLLDQIKPKP
jgi:serine/threonine protein kinase/Tfp pilus assembly protein PilF